MKLDSNCLTPEDYIELKTVNKITNSKDISIYEMLQCTLPVSPPSELLQSLGLGTSDHLTVSASGGYRPWPRSLCEKKYRPNAVMSEDGYSYLYTYEVVDFQHETFFYYNASTGDLVNYISFCHHKVEDRLRDLDKYTRCFLS